MKDTPIGGYFELELPSKTLPGYHDNALALTNGRACMSWILDYEKPSRVFLPYFCCFALYEPMAIRGIAYEFYSIDDKFDPVDLPIPGEGELLIYLNFFGLKNRECSELSRVLGSRLVVDDTHRFFHHGYDGAYSFTSARKHFGVPDGAYLYVPGGSLADDVPRFSFPSLEHGIKRLLGEQEAGFRAFQNYEDSLGIDVFRISEVSERLLGGIDYTAVMNKRTENFEFLDERLQGENQLSIDRLLMDIPFCYPFIPEKKVDKRNYYSHNIFVATLWPDILERNESGFDFERELTETLLPFPVDHRYCEADMNRICELTKTLLK